MLDNIKLAQMAADKPTYEALSAAAAPATSPILKLVESISAETRLTAAPVAETPADQLSATIDNAGGAIDKAQSQIEMQIVSRPSGLSRIGLEPVSYTHLDVYKRQALYHAGQ